jgi:ribosomal protein L37AE/L43A
VKLSPEELKAQMAARMAAAKAEAAKAVPKAPTAAEKPKPREAVKLTKAQWEIAMRRYNNQNVVSAVGAIEYVQIPEDACEYCGRQPVTNRTPVTLAMCTFQVCKECERHLAWAKSTRTTNGAVK